MGLVKRDSSSSNQPRELSFRIFPYKGLILIAYLEFEPLVLDRVSEKGHLQLQPTRDLSYRVNPYENSMLSAHLELEPLVLDGVGEEGQPHHQSAP
jgi:hypothetical protein